MPAIFYFWLLASLANLGLPALSGFVAEATVFYGAFTSPMAEIASQSAFVHTVIVVAATGIIMTAAYMLWLLKRLFYGPELDKWSGHLSGMKAWEVVVASVLCLFVVGLGVYPRALTDRYTPLADRMAQDAASHLTLGMRSYTID